jgi:hypothetical protein
MPMRHALKRRTILCVLAAATLTASAQQAAPARAGGAQAVQAADTQIRERVASIRDAILAKNAEGVVKWGTDDWEMRAADGTRFDRSSYLTRTKALMDRVASIDSLTTTIDSLVVNANEATVEITQLMERHERPASGGAVQHVRLKYRERHTWVRATDGWRVRLVVMLPGAEREVLTPAPAYFAGASSRGVQPASTNSGRP